MHNDNNSDNNSDNDVHRHTTHARRSSQDHRNKALSLSAMPNDTPSDDTLPNNMWKNNARKDNAWQNNGLSQEQIKSLIRHNHLSYLLYVLSFFTAGLLWVVPIIMNYARRREAQGTWLATHFDWQIKMFWYSLVFGVIGSSLIIVSLGGFGVSVLAQSPDVAVGSVTLALLGGFIVLCAVIWHLYRVIRGWVALADHRALP